MAGIAALIIKVMPDSPSADIKGIETAALHNLEKEGAKNISIQINEIAFGLKALMIKMAWPEQLDTDKAEHALQKIPHVSSVNIEDYRRAFG